LWLAAALLLAESALPVRLHAACNVITVVCA